MPNPKVEEPLPEEPKTKPPSSALSSKNSETTEASGTIPVSSGSWSKKEGAGKGKGGKKTEDPFSGTSRKGSVVA